MVFRHSVPILYSSDVRRSIQYYTEVLGFDNSWEWDDPPTFGGVSKDLVEIFFCKEYQGNPGTWIAVMVSALMSCMNEFYQKEEKFFLLPTIRNGVCVKCLQKTRTVTSSVLDSIFHRRIKKARACPPL